MRNNPAIHFEYFNDGVAAIIAAQIKPKQQIADTAITSLDAQGQRSEYIQEINYCVEGILKNTSLTSVALRYIFTPSNNNKTPQFNIVCLIRSDGQDANQAKQKVHHAWNEFENTFPQKLYLLTLVTQKHVLEKIRQPINLEKAEIIELRKYEDIVPVKYVAAGEYYYSVKAISSRYKPIEDLLLTTKEHNDPFVINICFLPTHLTNDEDYTIRQIQGQLHNFAVGFSTQLHSGTIVFEPDLNAEICLDRYIPLVENAASLAQFKIQIIAQKTLPQHTISSIAQNLCHDYQLEFVTEEHKEKAIWTYLLLDPTPLWGGNPIWDSEAPPHSLRRISHLITPDEMLRLFRLPILFHKQKSAPSIVFAERIEHMGDKNFSIHGNVTNSAIVANVDQTFGNITQELKASSSLSSPDLAHILDLLGEMQQALKSVPNEWESEIEDINKRVQKLTDELQAEKPEKDDLEYHGRKLIKAAENLKKITPAILDIAGRIVKFIITLSF